jgi:hypothetical protein
MSNLLGIPETRLPVDPAAAALAEGMEPQAVAAAYPSSPLAWATLAEDALRGGWKGQGPVPWSHEPNQGFLRSLAALSRAAGEIGETDEQQRCAQFLRDSSAQAADTLGL